ncbi:glycine-rich domain-containing protein [Prescottella agglutinans]|uniref:Uncharacterized protein n=1 Tax=Prescottella agglutinans TaxID=1644129 RepID=A0ABT6M701_9NOCA|nr:hypothetical protein [Prescottella agglutinans]MDH6279546.1 hypothetical protein [Prescottella agglutinans]
MRDIEVPKDPSFTHKYIPQKSYTKESIAGLDSIDIDQFRRGSNADLHGWAEAARSNFFVKILRGFGNIIDLIFGTVNNDYVKNLPIINDHSHTIEQVEAQIDMMLLQGRAIGFTTDNTWYPTRGMVSADIFAIGAGGGGGGGQWNLLGGGSPRGAGGGGGGGEIKATLLGAHMPKDANGDFLPVSVKVGLGGDGGASSEAAGVGGGNTTVGGFLAAGGGQGGQMEYNFPASGGIGMIRGGNGGRGEGGSRDFGGDASSTKGGDSYLSTDLRGGGGGGGAGRCGYFAIPGGTGGQGGIWAGGIGNGGGAGPAGMPANPATTTGGGGGAGGKTYGMMFGAVGGAGGFPGGGGGGGAGGTSSSGSDLRGGRGGNGIVIIVEKMG